MTARGLALGFIPICNRFSSVRGVDAATNLTLVECTSCGLIQLNDPPPPTALTPRLPWIHYREPEGHLDALAGELLALRPLVRTALGAGPFEQPLLSRLAAHGFQTQVLPLAAEPVDGHYPYLESWPLRLDYDRLAAATSRGTFDLVSCRYIVEHAREPVRMLRALQHLLNPDGLLLIEIPDSSKFLSSGDYCFLWEEHTSYFIEDTLQRLGEAAGCRVVALLRYPGALEDALVAVLEPAAPSPAVEIAPLGASDLFGTYRDNFGPARDALRRRLMNAAGPDRDGVALFGIGHHAIMFVNAFGLSDMIALAVDDDSDKIGLFPPGFSVPVVSSEALLAATRIRLCLFAVAPHIEGKVGAKLSPLAARGVAFRSIYAASDHSILKDSSP